jgi:hypothetical protein
MGFEEKIAQLKQISEIAALAGLKGEVSDDGFAFMLGFEMDGGRSQVVRVRPTMQTPDGQPIVTVESPALVVKKGLLSGISKDQAIELLRLNETVPFARFGIVESDEASMIVASIDHLLDTLDPDELRHSCWCVAMAADNYEAQHGGDDF